MFLPERRSIVKRLLALPFVSFMGVRDVLAQVPPPAVNEEDHSQKFLAVSILRHINTAESWHRHESGHFGGLEELNDSTAMNRLLKHPQAEKAGIGASLHARLHFVTPEVVPGWRLSLTPTADGLGYVALVTPVGRPDSMPSYASDERGVIFQGSALDASVGTCTTTAREAVGSPAPITTQTEASPRRLRSVIRNFAFGPASHFICLGCTACVEFPCCCGDCCSCQNGTVGTLCINCGCEGCPWCCCLF
jgi:hypothetical protein